MANVLIGFLNWIRNHQNYNQCVIPNLCEGKWKVSCEKPNLKGIGIQRYLILDFNKCPNILQRHQQKIPDFLIFMICKSKLVVVILELTDGILDDYEIKQIQGGSQLLEDMIRQYGGLSAKNAKNIDVYGYIIHARGASASEYGIIRKAIQKGGKIQIQEKKIEIKYEIDKCGKKLNSLIAERC